MKTIEQRAEEFANIGVHTGIEKSIQYTYKYAAAEQRKIDIDKACEWLRQCTTFQHPDYRHPVPFFDEEDIESFKRAMEE